MQLLKLGKSLTHKDFKVCEVVFLPAFRFVIFHSALTGLLRITASFYLMHFTETFKIQRISAENILNSVKCFSKEQKIIFDKKIKRTLICCLNQKYVRPSFKTL